MRKIHLASLLPHSHLSRLARAASPPLTTLALLGGIALPRAHGAPAPQTDPPPGYVDLNPLVRSLVDLTGVDPGSPLWLQYGCALLPGQGAAQPDFGWRQDFQIPLQGTPAYYVAANAILANAGYRPTFYLNLPSAMRMETGRPWGWSPGPDDNPLTTAWESPFGVDVTGHDPQHYSLKFLAALGAHPGLHGDLARAFLWRFAAQIAGTLRTDYYSHSLHSSREAGRVLDFFADALLTTTVDPEDAASVLAWIQNAVLPNVLPNGIGHMYLPSDEDFIPEMDLGSVPYWFPWQDGLFAGGLDRFGQLLETYGSDWQRSLGSNMRFTAWRIATNLVSVVDWDGGVPKAVGADGQVHWIDNEKYGYGAWCYRAMRIAGADDKANMILARFFADPEFRSFLVEPDGSWAPGLVW